MMDYINFVRLPELHRFSFQNLCENSKTLEEERSPIVCFIALKGPNFEEVVELFRKKIKSMEQEIYEQHQNKQVNYNSHI